eukprot:1067801-Pyramimonas_sp.AAC.1
MRVYLTDSKHLFLPIDDFQEQTITERTDLIGRIEHRTTELLHSCPTTTQARSLRISRHVDARAATARTGAIAAGQEQRRSAGASRRRAEKPWPGDGAAPPVQEDHACDDTAPESRRTAGAEAHFRPTEAPKKQDQ